MRRTDKYRRLDANAITRTAEALEERISARFPAAGLRSVCVELVAVAQAAIATCARISRPHVGIRLIVALLVLVMVLGIVAGVLALRLTDDRQTRAIEIVTATESVVNEMVLVGVAIAFLVTWETRVKRRRVLRALHELRSLAHIIDMHQLTKDPERLNTAWIETDVSPKREMDGFELARYLNYCAEMLALCSKIAALYVQGFNDGPSVAAVNEIEDLTTSLSEKVWQKIGIVDRAISRNAIAEKKSLI